MAILPATTANYTTVISGAPAGSIIELAAGDYNVNTGAWGDLSNSASTAGFVRDEVLDNWSGHILIRPAAGQVGNVRMGPHRKNKGGGSVNWPVIFEDIVHMDDEIAQPVLGNSVALIYDLTSKATGFRRPIFKGKTTSTDNGVNQLTAIGGTGDGQIVEDATYINVGQSIATNGNSIHRRSTHTNSWQQNTQFGFPDNVIVEDLVMTNNRLATGAHGDVVHLLVRLGPDFTTYTVKSLKRIYYWPGDSTDEMPQGFFGQVDLTFNANCWIDFQGGVIEHAIIIGNSQGGVEFTRCKNLTIRYCTFLTDTSKTISTEIPGIQLRSCDNITIQNCLTEAINTPGSTNIVQSNNVVLNAHGTNHLAALPNMVYGTAIVGLAGLKAATTPGIGGLAQVAGGGFAGAMKPGPGGIGFVLNDGLPVANYVPPVLVQAPSNYGLGGSRSRLKKLVRRR